MIAGIFVGGASSRMGGRPKGRLLAPADAAGKRVSIVERTAALARSHGARVVLVGRAQAYADLGMETIADEGSEGGGPLGGLVALLELAKLADLSGPAEGRSVMALACDMPYLDGALFVRLVSTSPSAPAVAPRDDGAWSPLFARYDAVRVAPVARARLAAGDGALRRLLDAVSATELPLSPAERATLRDWDEPADIDDTRDLVRNP